MRNVKIQGLGTLLKAKGSSPALPEGAAAAGRQASRGGGEGRVCGQGGWDPSDNEPILFG